MARITLAPALAVVAATLIFGTAASLSTEKPVPAELVAGRRLLAENNCNGSCHEAKVRSADPLAIYTRSTRRVNSREELKKQVEMCVSRLASPIFPDEIDSVVTALDHDGYHFD